VITSVERVFRVMLHSLKRSMQV